MSSRDTSQTLFDNTGSSIPKITKIKPGTSAAIFNGSGEILLEKRSDNGFWGLPGGTVDIGESLELAIKREVLEETGLHVRIVRLVGVYSDPANYTVTHYPDGNIVQHVAIFFECETLSGNLHMSEESTDLRYFPVDDLPKNLLCGQRSRIQDALAGQAEAFIR